MPLSWRRITRVFRLALLASGIMSAVPALGLTTAWACESERLLSTALSEAEWCEDADDLGKLTLTFKSGDVYEYEDVPRDIYDELIIDRSPGRFFHAHIRGLFPCRRVGFAPRVRPPMGYRERPYVCD
jgi:hypothetical protein